MTAFLPITGIHPKPNEYHLLARLWHFPIDLLEHWQ